ncbi:MAG: sigma-70 family RNA polymerase sigma factor [Bacteroidia bacterium]
MNNQDNIDQLTAHLFRENSGKMVAVLSRMFGLGQIDIATDVVQDTFETALSKWRFSGIPDNPSGWLMQVAKNKALNTFKRENKTQAFPPSVYLNRFDKSIENQFDILLSPKEIKDSQLRLLFTCCHPSFSTKNQIIITLNILCGFGIPEIANALLMNEEAVKKALTRGKASLRKLDNILQTNIIAQADERIKTVRTILYLMFNEGYKTTRSKEAINNDLCYEAIRLAKLLENDGCAVNSETNALIALMFFNVSRFPARLGTSDEWLTLEEQNRSLWNSIFIEEGCHYLNKATQSETLTRFHIEAIIASIHCTATTFKETNWQKIAYLYHQLEQLEPSPVVTLNRIIAESYLSCSDSIRALDELEIKADLKKNFLVSATKGDIYKRKGEFKNAQIYYAQALSLSASPADREFLRKKILQCQINKN